MVPTPSVDPSSLAAPTKCAAISNPVVIIALPAPKLAGALAFTCFANIRPKS